MPEAAPSVATPKSTLPPTCSVKNWVVFAPGFHKDAELYTPQRNEQTVKNFAYLTQALRHTIPRAGLGHDKQQRFARSLGFPNVGTITRCSSVPGHPGLFAIDVDDVPTEVGGEVNAGRMPAGSVELKGRQPDPRDPARELPGDVLTGVAFLGEEQPAVRGFPPELQERSRPRATFADGTLVPANPSPARWLSAMADVTAQLAAEAGGQFDPQRRTLKYKGRAYSAQTVCFSDFHPTETILEVPTMTPDEIQAKLTAAGKTPDEVAAIMALLGGAPAPAPVVPATSPTMSMSDICKKYAEDEKASPEQKLMASMYSDFSKKFADMEAKGAEDKKLIGELQASAEAVQKKDAEAAMAMMSDRVEKAVEPLRKKLPPVAIDAVHKPTLMGLLTSKTFAAETDRVKAFNDYLAPLLAQPDDSRLASRPGPAVDGPVSLNPETQSVLKHLAVTNPRSVARLTGAAAK